MGKQKYEVYLENIEVPIFKERFSLLFAKDPYQALYESDLLQVYADSFWEGDLEKAIHDLKGANAMAINLRSKQFTIMILPFDVTSGVIAHESLHLGRMILENRDIPFSDDTEEVYAHLLDYLVGEVTRLHDAIKKSRRKKKK